MLLLNQLEVLVGNTTRKNQETLAIALGRIIDKYRVPADVNLLEVVSA